MTLDADSPPLACGLTSLWDMLKFHAAKFVEIVNTLTAVEQALASDPANGWTSTKGVDLRPIVKTQLEWLEQNLKYLDLKFTLTKVETALWGVTQSDQHGYDPSSVGRMVRLNLIDIRERLKDELHEKNVYLIPDRVNIKKIEAGFGREVEEAFPSAAHDIGEAGKCLIFSRSTACVMHLMRVLEVGLNALADDLGVDCATENWNKILNDLETEIRSRNQKTHGPEWRDNEPFYAEAATHFRFIKNGWRNHAMHAREKYTEEEAEAIYENVKSFMRHLSGHLAEPGTEKFLMS